MTALRCRFVQAVPARHTALVLRLPCRPPLPSSSSSSSSASSAVSGSSSHSSSGLPSAGGSVGAAREVLAKAKARIAAAKEARARLKSVAAPAAPAPPNGSSGSSSESEDVDGAAEYRRRASHVSGLIDQFETTKRSAEANAYRSSRQLSICSSGASAAYEHGTETLANMYCRIAELSDNWRCGRDVSGVQLFAQRVY